MSGTARHGTGWVTRFISRDPARRLGPTAGLTDGVAAVVTAVVVAAAVTVTAIVAAVATIRPVAGPRAPADAARMSAFPAVTAAGPATSATAATSSTATSATPASATPASATPASATPATPAGADGPGGQSSGSHARTGEQAARQAPATLALTAADRRDCPEAAAACVDLARHITWLQRNGLVSFGPVPMEPGRPGSKHPTPRGTFHVAWKAGPAYRSTIYHQPMPWATFFAAGGIAFHGGSLTHWSHGCVHLTVASARYYNKHLPIGAEVVVF